MDFENCKTAAQFPLCSPKTLPMVQNALPLKNLAKNNSEWRYLCSVQQLLNEGPLLGCRMQCNEWARLLENQVKLDCTKKLAAANTKLECEKHSEFQETSSDQTSDPFPYAAGKKAAPGGCNKESRIYVQSVGSRSLKSTQSSGRFPHKHII